MHLLLSEKSWHTNSTEYSVFMLQRACWCFLQIGVRTLVNLTPLRYIFTQIKETSSKPQVLKEFHRQQGTHKVKLTVSFYFCMRTSDIKMYSIFQLPNCSGVVSPGRKEGRSGELARPLLLFPYRVHDGVRSFLNGSK